VLPLIPFALVLIVLSVLGLAGVGPLTEESRAGRRGMLGAVGPAVGLLVGIGFVALNLVAFGALVVLGSSDDGDEPERPRRPAAVVEPASPFSTGSSSATPGPQVTIAADAGASFPESYAVADGLARATVLRMRVEGFEPFARAVAEQCTAVPYRRCANPVPVQFDEHGVARFQYLVTDEFLPGPAQPSAGRPARCRASGAACTIAVRSTGEDAGGRRGEIQTIFEDELPPAGRIEVTPARDLSLDGEQVTVTVRDYPPGARVEAMLCAAPDAVGARCGDPGPSAPLVVGPDGTGRTRVRIEPGSVGAAGATCARGDDCGISVASEDVFARAPVVPIAFAPPPGAGYDPTRVVWGLAVAALLAGIATWLVRRSDWSPVGEAAAPEIDDVDYADLDAIIAALPPEDDEDLARLP
jgi:hypothetical protein